MDREIARVTNGQAMEMDGFHPSQFDEVARGDIDKDGDSDAALLYTIEDRHGANDYARFLAILENDTSSWNLVVQQKVGGKNDRHITLSGIVNGAVWADTFSYRPGDPSCCPSRRGRVQFEMGKGKLIERSSSSAAG